MRILALDEEDIRGGVDTLRRELLPRIARASRSLVWVPNPSVRTRWEHEAHDWPHLQVERWEGGRHSAGRLADSLLRRGTPLLGNRAPVLRRKLWERWWRHLAAARQCDMVFVPCVFSQPPPAVGLPLAGIICDVNPDLPDAVRENFRGWMRAATIFTISEFSASELRRLDPSNPGEITVVPFTAASPVPPPAACGEIAYDFFYPAAPNPHKGHAVLFEALSRLVGEGLHPRVVLSGPQADRLRSGARSPDDGLNGARERLAVLDGHAPGCIRILPDANPSQIDLLYSASHCVVLPSSYEGFGLPLAEALGRGLPVICTEIPPFVEQIRRYEAGDRAVCVPPGDANALAVAMRQSLLAPRPRLATEAAHGMVSRWTWEMAADLLWRRMRQAVSPRGEVER